MKSVSPKNQIAGSDGAIPAVETGLPAGFSDPKELVAQFMAIIATARGAAAPTPATQAGGEDARALRCIRQVEGMISREVLMVRQSGAEALAVSLKVDWQTSLFLQLTNHHGQTEACVRCESGDAGALAARWETLQESLARQNVQLLPLIFPVNSLTRRQGI